MGFSGKMNKIDIGGSVSHWYAIDGEVRDGYFYRPLGD